MNLGFFQALSAGSAFAILCFVRITLALLLLLVSAAPSWGANISFVPGGPITGFGLSAGENSQDSAMTGVMSSITANGTVDIDAGGTVNLVGSVIGSASDDLTIDAADMTFTHLEDYDNSSSSSAGFSMSPGNLPTLNFGNSSTEISGTTYATLGQGTFTIGGETFVNDQGATLTGDQIAYLTQNPGSTISNTPEGVLGSNHYEMTQENFVENVVLDSGALDVIAGSQDYELIYSLNGEWTPTQQGKFDAAMSDTLGDLFTSGDVSDFLDKAGDNLNPEVSYTGATDKINSLINGLNDDSISAADLGLPEGTTAEDAVEYLSGLLTDTDGTPLSDEDLSNNLAAMLDPTPSENCWDNPDAACDGVDADGRLFAGGDAIIAEDGPLAGANLNIGAAQTGLDVIEQEFQLDLNLQGIADLEENFTATANLVEAMAWTPPSTVENKGQNAVNIGRKLILQGASENTIEYFSETEEFDFLLFTLELATQAEISGNPLSDEALEGISKIENLLVERAIINGPIYGKSSTHCSHQVQVHADVSYGEVITGNLPDPCGGGGTINYEFGDSIANFGGMTLAGLVQT